MTRPMPTVIGGKYRVTRQLGQGGMGAVYEAVDEHGTRVAVKVIMTELANNPTLVGRFEREAKAASAIDTPHIARVLDTGTDPDTGLTGAEAARRLLAHGPNTLVGRDRQPWWRRVPPHGGSPSASPLRRPSAGSKPLGTETRASSWPGITASNVKH